jgi:hypothetical protein
MTFLTSQWEWQYKPLKLVAVTFWVNTRVTIAYGLLIQVDKKASNLYWTMAVPAFAEMVNHVK